MQKSKTDRFQVQIDALKKDINTYNSLIVNRLNQIINSLNAVSEIIALYDQAQADYYNILDRYTYEYNDAGSLSSNVMPRYSIPQMQSDTSTVEDLRKQTMSLSSEKMTEIARLERLFIEVAQYMQSFRDASSDIESLWSNKIAEKEIY